MNDPERSVIVPGHAHAHAGSLRARVSAAAARLPGAQLTSQLAHTAAQRLHLPQSRRRRPQRGGSSHAYSPPAAQQQQEHMEV